MNALSSKLPIESKAEWAFKTFQQLDLVCVNENFISKLALEELLARILPSKEEEEEEESSEKESNGKKSSQKESSEKSNETDLLVTDIAERILEELGAGDDNIITKEQFLAIVGKAHDQFYDSFTI